MFGELPGYRRIYPDLPGICRTPAPATMTGNDDVVRALLGLIDETVSRAPFLIIGHSYGGYLARAIANHRPDQAIGMALVCPVGERAGAVPAHRALVATDLPGGLDAEVESGFRDYFSRWQFREHPEADSAYAHPTLILLGRQDATAGYARQWQLLEHYPRATLAVLDSAGHALLHEQPELARRLIEDWLQRVG